MNMDPYQINRVHLKVSEEASDYINASPITLVTTRSKSILRFIATQGPKANSWSHIWRMLWHETESPAVIIMLTRTHEQGREKCYPYYPQSTSDPTLHANEHDEFGDGFTQDLHLVELSHDENAGSEVREISVSPAIPDKIHPAQDGRVRSTSKGSSKVHQVWHLLFEGWPDFSIPEGTDRHALLELIAVSRTKNANLYNPRIVHCSAGIGRTGVFIALDWLLQELEEGAMDDITDYQDPIMHVVELLRDQRPGMVQSRQQYIFLYEIMRECWLERWIKMHSTRILT